MNMNPTIDNSMSLYSHLQEAREEEKRMNDVVQQRQAQLDATLEQQRMSHKESDAEVRKSMIRAVRKAYEELGYAQYNEIEVGLMVWQLEKKMRNAQETHVVSQEEAERPRGGCPRGCWRCTHV